LASRGEIMSEQQIVLWWDLADNLVSINS